VVVLLKGKAELHHRVKRQLIYGYYLVGAFLVVLVKHVFMICEVLDENRYSCVIRLPFNLKPNFMPACIIFAALSGMTDGSWMAAKGYVETYFTVIFP
jgi:hypothetical protein